MPFVPTLSITKSLTLTAVRSFLLGVLPPGVEVVKGQINRVPEPAGPDFVVITPMLRNRLGTNFEMYVDDVLVGSIVGAVLTVSSAPHLAAPLAPGVLLIDSGGLLAVGTVLGQQLSGSVGGTGTYAVQPSQNFSGTIYAGSRLDLAPAELTVQVDVHGPNSEDNVTVIAGLWRSEYGVDSLQLTGLDIAPLYEDGPRQAPFLNAEQQVEYRWTLDCHLHVNPVITTPLQFAQQVKVTTIEADVPGLA